jgi:hypothetical protein
VDNDIGGTSLYWPGIDPNYYFKFAIPYIVNDDSDIGRVVLNIDEDYYDLSRIEDIGIVAEQAFKVKEPLIFLKSITRTVIKGIAAEKAKTMMEEKNPGIGGDLMSLATDIAIYASENADLRTSRFFPNAVLISDISVQEGDHTIAIEYYDYRGNLLYRDDKGTVNISKDKLNLIESWQLQ